MNKRLTSLLLTVVMLLSLLAVAAPALATPTADNGLKLSTTTVSPGDEFELYWVIPQITENKSKTNEFKVGFDKSKVTLTEFKPNTPPGAVISAVNTIETANNIGNVGVIYSAPYGADWSAGMTYTYKFKVAEDAAPGNVEFKITSYILETYEADGYTPIDLVPAGYIETVNLTITAPTVAVTGVTLDKNSLSLTAGGHETLTATVNPDNATNKAVTWSSSDTEVATVDDTGKVTGVKKGTATITVKTADGGFTASCAVTVSCAHSEKIDHPAQASTCKDKGWDAYDECKECHQLFDKDGNKIDAIPYRALSATHTPAQTATEEYLKTPATCTSAAVYYEHCSVCGKKLDTTFTSGALKAHTESGWKMNSDGHWKVCTVCNHVTTEMVPHTPDHEGHATEAYAIKCTVCGYEIEAQLAHTHHLTPVPAKAATCTEAGNKAYYTCSGCDNWYEDAEGTTLITDHDSVKLAALNHDWKDATCTEPKTCQRPGCGATEGDPLGHNPGEEWKMNESTHWHICTRCNEQVNETLGRHEPDREAPTVNDPVKCKDCGYEIMPKLPTVTVELPFTVTVKQGGNVAPGKQAFELELFNIGNSNESEYADVKITATVETNGKGDYTARLAISGSEEQVNALISEGFYVREKNTKAEGWTYSDAVWHVVFEDSIPTVYPTTMETTDNGVNYEDGEAVENNTMTFVNTYTVNETPKPTPDTPKTGDNGATVWLIALPVAALAATAVVIGKKKHESE